jgi:hypothetical protein
MFVRVSLTAFLLGVLPCAPALAQNTSFEAAVPLLVGQTPVRTAPAAPAEPRFYTAGVVVNRSYCGEVTPGESETAPAAPTLTVLRADMTSELGSEGAMLEPRGLSASRICFIAPATESVFLRVATDAGGREFTLRFVETTLWTNWFFVGGNYSSYTLLRNTTNQPLTVDLRWRNEAGSVVGTRLAQTLPANGVIYIDARAVLNCMAPIACAQPVGSVEVAHTGSPEAIVGSQTTMAADTGLSFDTLLFQRRTW